MRRPLPPRRARRLLLPVASSPVLGFITSGSLATLTLRNEADIWVRSRYGSRFCFTRLRQLDYSNSRSFHYLSNGQLQGKLLSVYKVSQACPGAPDNCRFLHSRYQRLPAVQTISAG